MIGKKADGSLEAGVGVDPVRLDGALNCRDSCQHGTVEDHIAMEMEIWQRLAEDWWWSSRVNGLIPEVDIHPTHPPESACEEDMLLTALELDGMGEGRVLILFM